MAEAIPGVAVALSLMLEALSLLEEPRHFRCGFAPSSRNRGVECRLRLMSPIALRALVELLTQNVAPR